MKCQATKCQGSRGGRIAMVAAAVSGLLFAATAWAGPEQADQPAAEADDAQLEGPIVQIRPDDRPAERQAEDSPENAEQAAPPLWIGIQGRPVESDVLRTQLRLAADLGVVVEEVVPDSPADKAGLRQHDILIAANGAPLQDMIGLVKLVRNGKDKPIHLKLIRLTKEEEITVKPEEMPAEMRRRLAQANPVDALSGDPNELFRQLLGRDGAVDLRGFGFGGEAIEVPALPGGVSVTVTRTDKGPAKITVQRGDEFWTIESDDPKALEQLPEDLRPFVKRMLEGQVGGNLQRRLQQRFNFGEELEDLLPDDLGNFRGRFNNRQDRDPMLKRMRELERQMEELQRRLEEDEVR